MNSFEIIKRTIQFESPERIGYDLPDAYGSDICIATQGYQQPIELGNGYRRDQWGAVWHTLDQGMGEITAPPLETLEDYDHYQWPDLFKEDYWESARREAALGRQQNKYILAGLIVRLFEQMHFLRGIDNLMMDFFEDRARLEKMADDCVAVICKLLDYHAEYTQADGFISMDDWGLQERLLISPALWREFFKPRYAAIYAHAHRLGMHTFLHSCGYIVDILDDLIDIGLDVIQMDQQMNMGLDRLSSRFGGRITFWCPVDIQAVMPCAAPAEVAEYAREMMYKLGKFNGGFIGKWYPQYKAVNHSWDNINAMASVFTTEGRYPLAKPDTFIYV